VGTEKIMLWGYTPLKINKEPEKYPLGKGETSTHHHFSGSMFLFGGCTFLGLAFLHKPFKLVILAGLS